MSDLVNFNQFSSKMQMMIDHVIENATEFAVDMMHDCDEQESTTLAQFRESVVGQATYFLQNELDPEYADIQLPARLVDAITERVKDQVRIMFNFQGA